VALQLRNMVVEELQWNWGAYHPLVLVAYHPLNLEAYHPLNLEAFRPLNLEASLPWVQVACLA